ncbi:hypothetical protein [Haloferax marisrubri]|uniref:DUF1102 domain-containing protein n=1 Tax=Haloferax marisrubri TaxID=1544719 RepID=A0A2P4NQN8_9EURY|nr:hypothetical protein [Haloferax marisrubri]POG55454.1 hypothetical protein AUR65_008545 [Haloferax marisrubri]
MPTRRQTLFVLSNFFIVGGVLGVSATTTTQSTSGASFRIVAPDYLSLTAANDPPIHVETDASGYVTRLTPGGDKNGVNKRAITRFEDIVRLTNVSETDLDGVYFEFDVTSDSLSDSTLEDVEAALQVTAGDEALAPGSDGDDLLDVSPAVSGSEGVLGPGESVPFGLQLNLIPWTGPSTLEDLPDPETYSATLRIHVERESSDSGD